MHSSLFNRRQVIATPMSLLGLAVFRAPMSGKAQYDDQVTIRIAAADATSDEIEQADVVCDGSNDREVVRTALLSLPEAGGTLQLSSGTFDFGGKNVVVHTQHDITIAGAGMDKTLVRNDTTREHDLEPFSYTISDRAIVRDMTIEAAGPERPTSDALDFDGCNECLVERVRITASRGRGIVFDGKDPGYTSIGNRIVECEVSDCPGSGIELLATESCEIIDCVSTGNIAGVKIKGHPGSGRQAIKNRVQGGNYSMNDEDGIAIFESSDNEVVDATCESNGRDGIRVQTFDRGELLAERNVIAHCVCRNSNSRSQQFGVRLMADPPESVLDTVVEECDLRGNLQGGLSDEATGTVTESNTLE